MSYFPNPIQSARGNTPRSLNTRFADTCNVKDFGAQGNGVTDDTTAIQSAINSAITNGGKVYFPSGQYRITSGLTCTVNYNAILAYQRVSFEGDGAGSTQIVWDGANSPNTYMLSIQPVQPGDSVNAHDLGFIRGIGFTTAGGKAKWASGLKLTRRAFIKCENLWFHSCNVGMYLDNVISSTFDHLVIRFCGMGCINYGAPFSNNGVYANNAQTWLGCIFGANDLGGMDAADAQFQFFGGTVEVNGTGANAGSGFGVRVRDTGNSSATTCMFYSTYFEGNGTTGNLGTNPSVADVWIQHTSTVDNLAYAFYSCVFNRLGTNYAPHTIYLDKTSTTAANLTYIGCQFMDYNGYVGSSSRRYVVLTGSQIGTAMNVGTLNNYYNQPVELPTFVQGASIAPSTLGADILRPKNISAVALSAQDQMVPANTWHTLMITGWEHHDADIIQGHTCVVPQGVTRVKVSAQICVDSQVDPNTCIQLRIIKNQTTYAGMPLSVMVTHADLPHQVVQTHSATIEVQEGDVFEAQVYHNHADVITIDQVPEMGVTSWFSLEMVQ